MKKITVILFLFSSILFSTFGQKLKDTDILQRGPFEPIDKTYKNVKTYSTEVNLPTSFEQIMHNENAPVNKSYLEKKMKIWGLKQSQDGELKIKFNITKFEYLGTRTIERAPAWILGIEANVEVFDATGKLIYKRYQVPTANTYIFDPNTNFEYSATLILTDLYSKLMNEFEYDYLYQPAWTAKSFEFDKLSKKEDVTEFEQFNQSVQVFPAIAAVNREEWGQLFSTARTYWETLLKYDKNKDKDINQRFRLAANYSLASSYLLTGELDKADKYMQGIKENDFKFLGTFNNYPHIEKNVKQINEAKLEIAAITDFTPIDPEPVLPTFMRSNDVFRYIILDGETMDKKSEHFTGKIKIINRYPPRIDYRSHSSGGGIGAIVHALNTDNNDVEISIEGEKKPVKRDMNDLLYVKTTDGKDYKIGLVGSSIENLLGGGGASHKRYALFEEIQQNDKLTVVHEVFPYNEYFLRKGNEEEYYTITSKKSLAKYLETCPAMQDDIAKGKYNSRSKGNYLQIYRDFSNKCK